METTKTETPKAAATPKPKTERKPKTAAPDYSVSITGTTEYPRYAGKVPAELAAKYPAFSTIAARLSVHGFTNFKFFFTFASDLKKASKRTGDQFYITPARYAGKVTAAPAGLFVSQRHKITGKIFFRLFPEVAPLFNSIGKAGGGNYILNIAFEHRDKPGQRREHIIRTASADKDAD